jgi:oligopeptide/dipeptide ABC transporter ATP-binding protein
MLQRATIAMGVACGPELIIADEPTTALDVTIQAQILKLLRDIRDEQGTAILLITHDLGVVAEICDRVVVMYAGRVLETGTVHDVFRDPQHPYTRGLFAATPRVESKLDLDALPPLPPRQSISTSGCSFAERCTLRHAACEEEPTLISSGNRRSVRCWLSGSGK